MCSMRSGILTFVLGVLIVGRAYGAEWQEPKDGVFSEKQLVNYLALQKEAIANWTAAGKAVDGSSSSAAAIAVYMQTDSKFKASLAAHGLSQEEYTWLGSKVWEAWGKVAIDQMMSDATKGLMEQKASNEQKLADLKQKLADRQKAQADGRQVMTREERERAVQAAKDEHQAALDDARQHADEQKQAQVEADKAAADAKAADAAAKNPPGDVSADDRPGFIEGKKAEAQQARDSQKEALEKVAEAKKLADDSLAKAAAAEKRAANPDLPVTDDEKAEVKKANEAEIESLKADIAGTEQGIKLLSDSATTYAKSISDEQKKNPVPQQNVDLLNKHRAEFESLWGMKSGQK